MKKLLAIILICTIILSLTACGAVAPVESVSVNVNNKDNLSNGVFGRSAMVEIGDFLWYDSTTRIVYWWDGHLYRSSYYSNTPTPYYAPNGLPYKYNPETNTFEEIG